MKNKETLEEVAKDFANNSAVTNYEEGINVGKYQGFIAGAKWQQERSYSYEEVLEILTSYAEWSLYGNITYNKWLEQFNK